MTCSPYYPTTPNAWEPNGCHTMPCADCRYPGRLENSSRRKEATDTASHRQTPLRHSRRNNIYESRKVAGYTPISVAPHRVPLNQRVTLNRNNQRDT